MFSCAFVGSRYRRNGWLFRSGIIVFNGNAEVFDSPIGVWTEDEYERSWIDAINRVTSSNPKKAAIITGFAGMKENGWHWWPMYPDGKSIVIQEQYLMIGKAQRNVSESSMFDLVPDRGVDEEVSEWNESSEALLMFGHCLQIAREAESS